MKTLIKQGDWLAQVDLKAVYFTIPIHTTQRKYLILKVVSFHLPLLQSVISILGHDNTSDSTDTGVGSTLSNIHGEHATHGRDQQESPGSSRSPNNISCPA